MTPEQTSTVTHRGDVIISDPELGSITILGSTSCRHRPCQGQVAMALVLARPVLKARQSSVFHLADLIVDDMACWRLGREPVVTDQDACCDIAVCYDRKCRLAFRRPCFSYPF